MSPARAAQNASSSATKRSGATLPNAPQKQWAHLRGVGGVYARRAARFLDVAHAHEARVALLEDRVREREVQPDDENILERQRAHRVRLLGVALLQQRRARLLHPRAVDQDAVLDLDEARSLERTAHGVEERHRPVVRAVRVECRVEGVHEGYGAAGEHAVGRDYLRLVPRPPGVVAEDGRDGGRNLRLRLVLALERRHEGQVRREVFALQLRAAARVPAVRDAAPVHAREAAGHLIHRCSDAVGLGLLSEAPFLGLGAEGEEVGVVRSAGPRFRRPAEVVGQTITRAGRDGHERGRAGGGDRQCGAITFAGA